MLPSTAPAADLLQITTHTGDLGLHLHRTRVAPQFDRRMQDRRGVRCGTPGMHEHAKEEKEKRPGGDKSHAEPFRGLGDAMMLRTFHASARPPYAHLQFFLEYVRAESDRATENPTYPRAMLLSRVVRLALVPGRGAAPTVRSWNEVDGWSACMEVAVTVKGTPDPITGYIVGIQEIDRTVKECASRIIPASFISGEPLERALGSLREALISMLAVSLNSIAIRTHALCELRSEESMPHHVIVTQRFDFSSSHRLHCPTLSDAENRRVFGKCNNPAGHGHNYRLEVEVRIPLVDAPGLRASDIDRIAREHAVDRLDHKHLNSDVEAFRDRNPSVESIAATCFDWLAGPIRAAGGELARVRVWETEKTSAIYPG